MPGTYLKRILDSYIKEYLEAMGAVLIEGPKWCGKTRTSEEIAGSILRLDSKKQIEIVKTSIGSGLNKFLEGDTPRLIDEWQEVPEIWDAVRFEVDHRSEKGQFILTGSSSPPKDSVVHSGAGRIARITMRPMSLFESGESTGHVSLSGLFDPKYVVDGYTEVKLDKIAFAITRGGWPRSINETYENATRIASQYVSAIVNSDLLRPEGVRKDPPLVRRIIESISRNISTPASRETVRRDVNGIDGNISDITLTKYLRAMEEIFLIENLPAWNPHIRSKTRLMKTPKWHFTDPSIAAAALKVSSDALLMDYNAFGLMFESLCVRDLRIYSQPLEGHVSYFNDNNGKEVDIIIELPGGKWGAVEVKLGDHHVDEGAKNLLRLRDKIDTEYMKQPSFLMVLTAGQFSYRRPDGVAVVSISCLRD
ncbi:MAG: DUF4143 domain-containing protein [Methanomassiliicoccaceae archaeon]|nr:DUF4143 domain-containing protein [Methanomassiliicoccaceae archaeon]